MALKKNRNIDPGFVVAATHGREDLINMLALRARAEVNSISGSWPGGDDPATRQTEIESAQLEVLLHMLDWGYPNDDERPSEATRHSMVQAALNMIRERRPVTSPAAVTPPAPPPLPADDPIGEPT